MEFINNREKRMEKNILFLMPHIPRLTSYIIPFVLVFVIGCRKDPKTPAAEQELITTLKLTLTDTAAPYLSQTFIFADIDGDGGETASIDTIKILAGKVFNASLLLLDERNFPADTSTNEIKSLNTEHQFFYQSMPSDMITNFTYLDFDDNGKPLGDLFECKTNAVVSNGILRITLRHQPNKNGLNVSNNDITNADGETDIEVNFPVILH